MFPQIPFVLRLPGIQGCCTDPHCFQENFTVKLDLLMQIPHDSLSIFPMYAETVAVFIPFP